jgi:hypothetical protein
MEKYSAIETGHSLVATEGYPLIEERQSTGFIALKQQN